MGTERGIVAGVQLSPRGYDFLRKIWRIGIAFLASHQ